MSPKTRKAISGSSACRAGLGMGLVALALSIIGSVEAQAVARSKTDASQATCKEVCDLNASKCSRCDYLATRTLDAVLELSRLRVRRGGKFRVRVNNVGKAEVRYADLFTLERYEKGHWLRLAGQGPFFAPLHELSAGVAGPWQVVDISRSSPPGLYRVQKWVRGILDDRSSRFSIGRTFRVSTERT